MFATPPTAPLCMAMPALLSFRGYIDAQPTRSGGDKWLTYSGAGTTVLVGSAPCAAGAPICTSWGGLDAASDAVSIAT